MVLELILSPKEARKKPHYLFGLSALLSLLAIWLANMTFPQQASAFAVALIAMFFIPYFNKLLSHEEFIDHVEAKLPHQHMFLMRHKATIISYSTFFMGVIVAFSFAFIFMEQYSNVFSLQQEWFKSANIAPATGNVVQADRFHLYLANNTQVMLIFFILSVVFGAGAIFILAWNASVIAVFLGFVVNNLVPSLGHSTAYVYGVSVGLLSIALHGIPEIGGYFFAGIAGGILSFALIRENPGTTEFNEVLKDALVWLLAGEALIIIGAFLEALVI